uniref:UDP-glucose 4-epimerase n=2 Tax=Meloidogyne incognita group TaxID=654580 RepID=A0A914LF17_MELIC
MSKGTVLVTGAAGFIGSHTVLQLLEADYDVLALDNFSNSIPQDEGKNNAVSLQRVSELSGKNIKFFQADVLDLPKLEELFEKARKISFNYSLCCFKIWESVAKPLDYYNNNIVGSLNLIKCCQKFNVKEFIFSSSATVYGEPESLPLTEESRVGLGITNPYGQTKSMVERILMDLKRAEQDWKISILRYFNPVGAHPSGLIGEDPQGIPNNLMPYIAKVAVGKLPHLNIFGTNYNTPDGTGVRDYIHIVDLAKAHVSALDNIGKDIPKGSNGEELAEIYNLGTGKGYSVKEMVAALEKASGKKLTVKEVEPRLGDLAILYCDPSLALKKLGWKAEYGIDEMCRDTWNWCVKNPDGFAKKSE